MQSAVQVKMGIFITLIPGARIFTIVAMRFTPDSTVPTPATWSDQM